MGQLTQTTAQVQTILDNSDAANVGKTSLTDSTDTTAVAVKKSGFYSLGASSSNAPSTDRAILISAVRDTTATGEIRYGQVAITESNGMWWNRDDGGTLGTWYEAVSTAGTQTLTNKTLTSPILTTPQLNDTSADHQYIFAVSELVADRTVTMPLLTGNDTFVFEAHTQTLTNKTLTSPVFNTGVSGTAVLDDDTFATASSTTLATSESIKAYVDSQVGSFDTLAEVLAQGNTTGSTNIVVTAGQSITTDTVAETTAAAGVTIDSLKIKDGQAEFANDKKALFGAAGELEIYSDGTDSFIKETHATGSLFVYAKDFTVKNNDGSESMLNADVDGGVQLFHNNAQKLATTTTGVGVTGTLTAGVITIDSASTFLSDLTLTGANYNVVWDSSADALEFADNAKAIFGAGPELQIYSDGTSGIIKDVGAGDIKILADDFYVQNAAGSSTLISVLDTGKVGLGFAGSEKLATTSTGIDVTGTAVVDQLNIDSASYDNRQIGMDSNGFFIYNSADARYDMVISDTGNVGIGTSSPVTLKSSITLQVSGNAKLGDDNGRGLLSLGDIASTGANVGIWRGAAGAYAGTGNFLNLGGYDGITFTTGNADISSQTERLRIASGEVTVNESSQDTDFRVESDSNTHALFVDAGNDRVDMAVPLRVGYNEITATGNSGIGQFATATSGSGELWTDINTGANGYSSMPSEISVMNSADDTTNTFAGIFFQAGETSAGAGISSARIGAIRTAALAADLAFATRAAGTGTMAEHMRITNGGRVGIAESSPDYTLHVNSGTTNVVAKFESTDSTSVIQFVDSTGNSEFGTTGNTARISPNGSYAVLEASQTDVVFNNASQDTDFRVESDTNSHMLFVDASADTVGIGTSLANTPLTVSGSNGAMHSFLGYFSRETSDNTVDILSVSNQNANSGTAIYGRLVATCATSDAAAVIEFWAALQRSGGGANSATALTPVISKTIVGSGINAGTLAWSGTTLQYTTSGFNYIGYSMELQVTNRDGATITILP